MGGEGRGSEEAERSIVAALRLAPEFYDAYMNLGVLRRHQGRVDDAISALTAASKITPSSVQAYDRLAVAVLTTGQADSAGADRLRLAAEAMSVATALEARSESQSVMSSSVTP